MTGADRIALELRKLHAPLYRQGRMLDRLKAPPPARNADLLPLLHKAAALVARIRRAVEPPARRLTKDFAPSGPPVPATLNVDKGRMAVTLVISHRSRDREGDILEPSGLDLTNYALNPVVYLDHAKQFTLPIGRAMTPDGRLTVRAERDRVVATTYFSQTLREAEQVFHLIAEGMMPGASVGFAPRPGGVEPLDGSGRRYTDWELLEYSHTAIPMNPRCVEVLRSRLSAGKIAGRPMGAPLRGALSDSLVLK